MQSIATTNAALGFSAVYRENVAFVRAAIRRLGVPAWLEDDAVQDVFVVAHRHLGGFLDDADGAGVEGWLLVIARRIAFRHRRTATRQRRKLDALRLWLGLGRAEAPWQAIEARTLLGEMTQRLGRDQREAFEWCEVRGYTAMEAAAELGLNPNTVSTRLRAARLELRRVLVDAPIDRTPPSRAAFARGWLLLWPRLVTGSWWPVAQAGIWATASALLVTTGIASAVATEQARDGSRVIAVAPALEIAASVDAVEWMPPAEVPTLAAAATVPVPVQVSTIAPRRSSPPPHPTDRAQLPLLDAEQLADAWLAYDRGQLELARQLVLAHRKRHPTSPLAQERTRLQAKLAETAR